MLARSELNSIESKISEAFINNEISHKDFMIIINDERNYQELKKHWTDEKTKKQCWTEEGKK